VIKIKKEYAPLILRIGISLVFIWFGLTQIFNQSSLATYLPQFAYDLPVEPSTILLLNGIFETVLGGFLLVDS